MWGDLMLERSARKYIDSWIQSGREALLITGAYVKIGLNQEKPYKTRGNYSEPPLFKDEIRMT